MEISDLHTIAAFASKYPNWSEAALRNYRAKPKHYGMEGVFYRVGGRIMIDETAFTQAIKKIKSK